VWPRELGGGHRDRDLRARAQRARRARRGDLRGAAGARGAAHARGRDGGRVHAPLERRPARGDAAPVARFKTSDELTAAFQGYVDADAPEAYVLYRELDFFEQMAALERVGAFDLGLIKLLLGRTLIDRWELWQPAVESVHGAGVYPNLEALVDRLRREL
jgi:hypothetical protein